MKLNWGHSITIVIILFMAFILTLVYKMHYRNADLVQDDFYEQEVLFNSKKESIFNYEKADFKIKIDQTPGRPHDSNSEYKNNKDNKYNRKISY
jgi:hypothetical protein